MLRTIILIALGGSMGSILRYLTGILVDKYCSTSFPWATLIVNTLGCLLIGLLMGWLSKNQMTQSDLHWLLITGFCGGFTTFSAFSYENIQLIQSGNLLLAFLYISGSILLGIGSVWLGLLLAP